VKNRRPITEDDIYLTEILIAKSYGKLKHSVAKASADAFSCVGETVGGSVRKHPYATAGAAVGAGIILFGLFKLMNRGGSGKRRSAGDREHTSRSNMTMEILSLIMPMVTPYLTAYVEKYMGRMFSQDRN
jgi:hypothetical protein